MRPASFAKAAATIFGYIVVFDVIGVAASFVFDVLPLFGKSLALFYAIWFIAGVFCGLLGYNAAGGQLASKGDSDWSTRAESGRIGVFVLVLMAVAVLVTATPCYLLFWNGNSSDSIFVPDSMGLSLTFFISAFAAAVMGHFFFRPASK